MSDQDTDKKRVLLGMSGGVDSSMAARLLLQQGYDVTGVTMRLWTDDQASGCCSIEDVQDARQVADRLGIAHYVLNFREPFLKEVVEPFMASYRQGMTPNPCIACNQKIKFDLLLKRALAMDFDYVATGHYARIEWHEAGQEFELSRGLDPGKDQSYVLYGLTQAQLHKTLMPLGPYSKKQIRAMAAEAGLVTADKPDSQEICFIDRQGYQDFLRKHQAMGRPGVFIDRQGQVIGEHQGISCYTIGQRKGLGQAFGRRLFVTGIDTVHNTVRLGEEEDLFTRSLVAGQITLTTDKPLICPLRITARIRYQAPLAPAILDIGRSATGYTGQQEPQGQQTLEEAQDPHKLSEQHGQYEQYGQTISAAALPDSLHICFDQPQRAITPGQAVVFYDGDRVLGGGIIQKGKPD